MSGIIVMNTKRLQILQKLIKNPLLIKKKENLFYLTGKEFDRRAEEYLLVTKRSVTGFGSGLEHIRWIPKSDQLKNIGKYLKWKSRLDIEYSFTYGEGEYLKLKLAEFLCEVGPARSQADVLRAVKEPGEIARIKKSMQIVERVFGEVRKMLGSRQGRPFSEGELAQFIERRGLSLGAEDISFPAIVASGKNAAIPHHVPGGKKLRSGESIILDFGFKYKGYCSDFTRTVFLKKAPEKLAAAYLQVQRAYERVISASKPGASCGGLYDLAAGILEEKKLGVYFIHSLGHGTGLEIHELPNLSPNSKEILQPGMVFSVEPGVYFPRLGGIRIEDLVQAGSSGASRFINVPVSLKENIL